MPQPFRRLFKSLPLACALFGCLLPALGQGGQKLRSYVGEAQRSSSGSVFFVPSLLMKDIDFVPFGEMLSSMTGLAVVREEEFDGEVCHVVGGNIDGTPWLLWVGKESRLLRKTRTIYTSGSFHEMLEKKRVKTT